MNDNIVIVAAGRTAIGNFGGSLAGTPASELGAKVIKHLLESTGIAPEQVDEVILGQVLTAAQGQNPARQATLNAGLPQQVPAMTINMVRAVPEKILQKIIATIPVGRLGDPHDIARAVLFLVADDADFITGSTLSINGGQHMY